MEITMTNTTPGYRLATGSLRPTAMSTLVDGGSVLCTELAGTSATVVRDRKPAAQGHVGFAATIPSGLPAWSPPLC